jgi:SAM-dependent methyltransferase
MSAVRYDEIGCDYATTRREDPWLRDRVLSALGDSRTIVNVGAGTGSYEPRDRYVIAVEPSDVLAAQRPAELVPAIRGSAAPLMLRDNSVDAAMAILTVHHWDDQLETGVGELRRVARGPVVILIIDADVCADMWLLRDCLPEAAALDRATFPALARLRVARRNGRGGDDPHGARHSGLDTGLVLGAPRARAGRLGSERNLRVRSDGPSRREASRS